MSPPIDPPAMAIRCGESTGSAVEQLDRYKPEDGVADVFEIVDESGFGRVFQVAGIADVIVAYQHGAIAEALEPPAAFDHGPEVVAGVGVERSPFTRLKLHLPDVEAFILEPERGADGEVGRGGVKLIGEIGNIKGAFLEDLSAHAGETSGTCRRRTER